MAYAIMHMDVRMYIINTGSVATIYRFIDNIDTYNFLYHNTDIEISYIDTKIL